MAQSREGLIVRSSGQFKLAIDYTKSTEDMLSEFCNAGWLSEICDENFPRPKTRLTVNKYLSVMICSQMGPLSLTDIQDVAKSMNGTLAGAHEILCFGHHSLSLMRQLHNDPIARLDAILTFAHRGQFWYRGFGSPLWNLDLDRQIGVEVLDNGHGGLDADTFSIMKNSDEHLYEEGCHISTLVRIWQGC